MSEEYVLEVPSALKQLARLVARAFYAIEDALIVDMLVRNPCMKEDDICDLLKFERKMLRGRITVLKNDKILQSRLRMETIDGKSQKVNYYYINYNIFVNIVKYKLDHMRKKMETSERDATSRASFHCPNCKKYFTDLEADRLCNPLDPSGEFICNFCFTAVVEDDSGVPKTDTRQLMATFNEQMEPLYRILREVEDVKLAPSLLEPEPTDISHLQRDADGRPRAKPAGENWSGEATRKGGVFGDDQRVDIHIGDNVVTNKPAERKEAPVWMTKSTVINEATADSSDSVPGMFTDEAELLTTTDKKSNQEDIMSVLMELEKPKPQAAKAESSDDEFGLSAIESVQPSQPAVDYSDVEIMDSDSDDEIPKVRVGDMEFPVNDVPAEYTAKMTTAEKDDYVQKYQEYLDKCGFIQ